MLHDHDINGARFPAKTLCLTFDDGPGPHTRELAEYLFREGIQAVFFVVGQAAVGEGPLLRQLHDWGHVLGNHTWSHAGLVDLAAAGGNVVAEVVGVDPLIRPYASQSLLLRPPYGSWRPALAAHGRDEDSNVAELLRRSGHFDDYVGPVMWDIVGEDWEFWRRELSMTRCLQSHIEAVERAGRGIVLLHDSSEDASLKAKNRTAELVTLLVPILRSRGYRFVDPASIDWSHDTQAISG